MRIQFFKDKIIVGGTSFPRTPGLYNLIVHKKPEGYDSVELSPYREILEISKVHKNLNGKLKTHPTSLKYKEIISPLFELFPTTPKGQLPRTPTATFKKKT